MLAGPRHLALLLAFSLLACGDDAKPAIEDDDDGSEPSEVEQDAGRTQDARTESPRDAAVEDARRDEPDTDPSKELDAGAVQDAAVEAAVAPTQDAGDDIELPFTPALHIPLRVHRGDSGLSGSVLASVLEEVNEIWWKQAAVCFEIEIVKDDAPRKDGFDLWFHRSKLGCNTTANGVYCGDHDVHSLDAPSLGRADDRAWNVRQLPARTAAHELGHGLSLQHYNGYADSNDSLMSSGRQGFKLHEDELTSARKRATSKGSEATTPCSKVPVVD